MKTSANTGLADWVAVDLHEHKAGPPAPRLVAALPPVSALTRRVTGWAMRRSEAGPLALVLAGWLLVNVRWVWCYRDGHLIDIDEAGYFGLALNDYYAAGRDGLAGWLRTAPATGGAGPLVPAFTSLLMLLAGPRMSVAFAVALLAGLATILFSYATARRIGGRWLAWVCLALTASAPGLIIEARSYHFAGAAAAITSAACYSLVRSRGLASRPAAVAFGGLLGFLPMTRSMTIAYVPVLAVAAVAQAAAGPDRRRRLANCALAFAVAVLVAGSWLMLSGGAVLRYLLSYGYGTQSADYGTERGLLNPAAWLWRVNVLLFEHHLPHVAILVAGLGAAMVAALRAWRRAGTREFAVRAVRSPLFPLAALTFGGFAALLSSSNTGFQFALPLLPATVIVAGWGLAQVSVRLRVVTSLAVASAALLAMVPTVDARTPLDGVSAVRLPVLGDVPVADSRSTMDVYLGAPVDPAQGREWGELSDWAARGILSSAGSPIVAFGFHDRLINVNTVQVAVLRDAGYGVRMVQIDPSWLGDSYDDYRRWLTVPTGGINGDADQACLLFTSSGAVNEFFPSAIDHDAMIVAAGDAGFVRTAVRQLPGGRASVTLWRRDRAGC